MYELNELLNKISKQTTSSGKSRLYRSDSTANIQKEELTIYENRYKTFIGAIKDIDFSAYNDQKKLGFEQCLDKYIKIANNNTKNLDVIDENLDADLKECQNKLSTDANNPFIYGYRDCIKVINYFLQESKKAFFKKLAESIR